MAMDKHDIENRFTYHPPRDDEDRKKYETIRDLAKQIALEFLELCPESREKSLAITHLEEAVFWANASIARQV